MASNTYQVPVSDVASVVTSLPCNVAVTSDGSSFDTDLKANDLIDVPVDTEVTLTVFAQDASGRRSRAVTKTFRSQAAPGGGGDEVPAPTIGDPVFQRFNP